MFIHGQKKEGVAINILIVRTL